MPPKVTEKSDVLYMDEIYLGRKACVLAILDGKGEDEYFDADHKAYEDDKGNFPDASDYAVSTG